MRSLIEFFIGYKILEWIFKSLGKILSALFYIVLGVLVVSIVLTYLIANTIGAALFTISYFTIDRNWKYRYWLIPAAWLSLVIGLITLHTVNIDLYPIFFYLTLWGNIIGLALLAIQALSLFLHIFRKRTTAFEKMLPLLACMLMVIVYGVVQYISTTHVLRYAFADKADFPSIGHEIKRDKYRPAFEQFLKTARRFPLSPKGKYNKAPQYEHPYKNRSSYDSLVLISMGSDVNIIYYKYDEYGQVQKMAVDNALLGVGAYYHQGKVEHINPNTKAHWIETVNHEIENANYYGYTLHKEIQMEVRLMEPELDAYIALCEYNYRLEDQKHLVVLYPSLEYLKRHRVPIEPIGFKETYELFDRLFQKK